MDDRNHLLRAIAVNLTAKHRRYPDGGMAAGAHVLACLLFEYSERRASPDPDVVETFIGVAEKMLSTSTTVH
jgi:hypothetical protein